MSEDLNYGREELRMKEILTRNIGIKILAVILAAILWLVINNVEDPISVEEFHDIPVRRLNEQAIKSKNQDYQVIEGDKVDVTVAARRSIIDSLKESNFVATADLSKVTDMNTVTINVSCPGYDDDVIIKKVSHQVMTISREEVVQFRDLVKVKIVGEPAEGFYVAKKTSNTLVTVSGPKSKVEKIKEIIAEFDVTDEAQAGVIKTYSNIKVVDEEGAEIDKSHLTFSQEMVPISIEIYPTKIIDIVVTTKGKPADGYYMTNIEYGPKEIEIAGKSEVIDKIDILTVTENIEGATGDIKKEINLNDFLEEGLIIVEEDETAFVNITIEKEEIKRVTIKADDISIRNKPVSSVILQTTGLITLELSGPGSELDRISSKAIKPYIDLYHYTFGYGIIDVILQIEPIEDAVNVQLANAPRISVYISP